MPRAAKPAVFGTYLLLSAETGETLAVMDATRLTAWRTGAASALASRYLSRADASRLLMVGAGALAPQLVAAHASVRPIREVALWNRSPDRARALAGTLAARGLDVSIAGDLEAAVRRADIVSAATISAEPLIRGDWLAPGTHVDCVGAYKPSMRETDDAVVRRARIFVDTRISTTSPARPPASPLPISPPASSTACSTRDNIAITAQSFDYGPWRWTPSWDGHFTAAYFDHQGLYSFGRQPEAIHWDLVQLAIALRRIAEAELLTAALETFPGRFQAALRDALFARLGIVAGDMTEDMKLVAKIEEALAKQTVTIDRFFFDWRGGRVGAGLSFDESRALVAAMRRCPARSTTPIGPIPNPARCNRGGRSDLVGDRRGATTGRRSTPRSQRSAGWAPRWPRKCLKNPDAPP